MDGAVDRVQQVVGAHRVGAQRLDDGLVVALRPQDRQIGGAAPAGCVQCPTQLRRIDGMGHAQMFRDDVRQGRHLDGRAVGQGEQQAQAAVADALMARTAHDPVVRREQVEVFGIADTGAAAQPVQQPAHPERVEGVTERPCGVRDEGEELPDGLRVAEVGALGEPAVPQPPVDRRRRLGMQQGPLA